MASPEDTPMKKQWLEVDGRMTPVILPQIWNHDKEEWEVTSEQNPLPTQVTGSNMEDGLPTSLRTSNSGFAILEGEIVPANSDLVSDAIKFKGTRVSIGIRYDKRTNVKINIAPYATDVNLAISSQINVVDIPNGTRGINDVKLLSNNNAIVIKNESDIDIIITRLSVTEFMASGNGGD